MPHFKQVGLNCDDVADWLHANNPDMSVCLKMKMRILNFLYTKTFTFRDVKCIADSPDFIAPEVIEKPP